MHRLVCLGWISTPEGKDNFSFETQVAHSEPSPTSTALVDVISDAAVTQWLLGTNPNAQRNAFHRGGPPQSRLFANIGIRISTKLTFELIPATAAAALAMEVGGRNNVGEIDCHSNVAGWVRSSDDAVILVDELPKRQD